MKRLIIIAGLLAAGPLWAVGDFLKTVTPEELAATGLDQLTPAQLARLEAVVQRYKSGEVAVVRQEAEQKVAAVEARTREGREAGTTEERRKNYWAFLFGEVDTKQFAIETTLPGEFSTFDGRPIFKLANGQQWRAIDPLNYYCRQPLHDPPVTVKPGALGSFWLEIKGGPRVKVQPVRRD